MKSNIGLLAICSALILGCGPSDSEKLEAANSKLQKLMAEYKSNEFEIRAIERTTEAINGSIAAEQQMLAENLVQGGERADTQALIRKHQVEVRELEQKRKAIGPARSENIRAQIEELKATISELENNILGE